MTLSSQHNNRRIAKNTLALSARMFLTIVVGVYSSRLVLKALGVVDYGIYNVVGGVVTFFVFINATLTNATQRFLNFYMGEGNKDMVCRVFSTSRRIFILLALFIFVLGETIGVVFVNYILDIPPDRLAAANAVCQFTVASAVIDVLSLPYNALIVSYERMVVFAYISVAQSLAVLGGAFLLQVWNGDRLVAYAALLCFIQIAVRVYYGYFCKKNFGTTVSYQQIEKPLLKEMLSFSGWSLTGAFAYVTYTQGIPILFNLFFGPVINAANALVQQVNASLSTFGANFMMATNPQITKYYAEGDKCSMTRLVYYSSKLSVAIMLVVSLPFLVMPDYLLSIWLVEVPRCTSDLLQMMLWATLLNALSTPANTAIQSTGTVKSYQAAEAITLLLVLPAVFVALKTKHAAESAYLVLAVFLGLVQAIRIVFLHNKLGVRYRDYIQKVIVGSVLLVVLSYIVVSGLHQYVGDNLIGLAMVLVSTLLAVTVFFMLICINRQDRRKLYACAIDKFRHRGRGKL